MKSILLSCLVLAFLLTTPAAAADNDGGIEFSASVGLGTGFPWEPDDFADDWDSSFGGMLEVAARKSLVELSVSFDYNFFLSTGVQPNDANVLTVFGNIKIKPIASSSVHPYILVGGGYYRYWIVDLDLTDNTLGMQAGAGVEIDISKTQRIFIDAKEVVGRTRETNALKENTYHIPVRIGLTFVF